MLHIHEIHECCNPFVLKRPLMDFVMHSKNKNILTVIITYLFRFLKMRLSGTLCIFFAWVFKL